jgi:hypothetical protein
MAALTPAEVKYNRRNINPHAEAHLAMVMWGNEYCQQNGGSMDFWDALSPSRKTLCREMVEKIKELPSAHSQETVK